jgi:hypothetical protein
VRVCGSPVEESRLKNELLFLVMLKKWSDFLLDGVITLLLPLFSIIVIIEYFY